MNIGPTEAYYNTSLKHHGRRTRQTSWLACTLSSSSRLYGLKTTITNLVKSMNIYETDTILVMGTLKTFQERNDS